MHGRKAYADIEPRYTVVSVLSDSELRIILQIILQTFEYNLAEKGVSYGVGQLRIFRFFPQ